ncbi:hypothetical protein [Paraburkholderia oxyphila]|uniref:hypothetical protein n=1 Tax=Paraburkholderia oxyphila TaxID=614212 RepID=UPI0012EDE2BE|nr:hypothetical protein [Paraburkholderia oxyphila]
MIEFISDRATGASCLRRRSSRIAKLTAAGRPRPMPRRLARPGKTGQQLAGFEQGNILGAALGKDRLERAGPQLKSVTPQIYANSAR